MIADQLPERERFAEALAIERIHGDAAGDFIVERVKALSLAGDHASVRRWLDIADRLQQLQRRALSS